MQELYDTIVNVLIPAGHNAARQVPDGQLYFATTSFYMPFRKDAIQANVQLETRVVQRGGRKADVFTLRFTDDVWRQVVGPSRVRWTGSRPWCVLGRTKPVEHLACRGEQRLRRTDRASERP